MTAGAFIARTRDAAAKNCDLRYRSLHYQEVGSRRVPRGIADDVPSKLVTKRSQLMSVGMSEHNNIVWLVSHNVVRTVGRN